MTIDVSRTRRLALALSVALVALSLGCVSVKSATYKNDGPDALLAMRWYRTSAERRALYLEAYRLATTRVEAAAATRNAGAWGVVLDVDETILDGSAYQLEAARGNGFDEQAFRAFCRKKLGKPLPGARAFLERVHALGGRIALVTNRDASVCAPTKENLAEVGLPFDEVLCREGEASDKNARFAAIASGTAPSTLPPFEIVLFAGDNIQDFPGLKQDAMRSAPDDAYAEFGIRFISLPNPMYGSWQKNTLE